MTVSKEKKSDEGINVPEIEEEDEDEIIEEAAYEDALPQQITQKTVEAIFNSSRTGKKVKMTFIIKSSGALKLPSVIRSQKYLQEYNTDGSMNMNLLKHIISMWPDIIVKQPNFFKEDLKRFNKGEATFLDGEIFASILVQIYTAYQNLEEYVNPEEKQVKNLKR